MPARSGQSPVQGAPDKLSAQLQPAGGQPGSDDLAVQSAEPDIGGITGEERIRLPPVGTIVVEHLASLPVLTLRRARQDG